MRSSLVFTFRTASLAIFALLLTCANSTAHAGANVSMHAPRLPTPLFEPVAVFGTDDRRPVLTREAALNGKIGILEIRGSSICTAFCIAPDAIATASHCLLGTEQTRPPELETIRFHLGAGSAATTTPLQGRTSQSIRRGIVAGTERLRVTSPIEAANDWAVVRLAEPACRAGWLAVSTASRDEIDRAARADRVYQVAMHRDISAQALVVGHPCRIGREFPGAPRSIVTRDFADEGNVLLHTCDTGLGSSGSPLLIDGGEGPEVAGINVGTYVLTRMSMPTSLGETHEVSTPVANTAVLAARFKAAVDAILKSADTASVHSFTGPRRITPEPAGL